MDSTIIVAVIGALASLAGGLIGAYTTSNLVQYRLSQLEEKVNKHNNVIERMTVAEGNITELQHDVRDLKEYHKPQK